MDKNLQQTLDLLRAEEIAAIPTETVYGLAGDATSDTACARIFAAKDRPSFNPLIAHMANITVARDYVIFSPMAEKLADTFWPGPLTLVLPRKEDCALSPLTNAGHPTQAVRVPNHPVAREILEAFDKPLAAPSANRSGHISPTTADHVRRSLGDETYVLDAGPCAVGLESTIVKIALGKATLLRAGGIATETIEDVIGGKLSAPTSKVEAPGMMTSHYAPEASVRLEVTSIASGEVWLGFGKIEGDVSLSPSGNLVEAAANLFRLLHELDSTGKPIAVAPIPNIGLGRAINDRLTRAAAPRD